MLCWRTGFLLECALVVTNMSCTVDHVFSIRRSWRCIEASLLFYPVITGLTWIHLQTYGHYENSLPGEEFTRRICFIEDRHAVSSCRPKFRSNCLHLSRCRRRQRDQFSCVAGAASCWPRPFDGLQISLRVSGISRSSHGRAPSGWLAAKNAWARRSRMVQLRTWCSSRAASSLPTANPSSTFHRDPATFTIWANGTADGAWAR